MHMPTMIGSVGLVAAFTIGLGERARCSGKDEDAIGGGGDARREQVWGKVM